MFDLDFADVKPSLVNWLIIGFSAATFIVFMKWVFNRKPVPGLTDFINAI